MKLSALKNIGPRSAHWLASAGVGSVEALRALGSVKAYVRLKKLGYPVSLNLVYAIEGALIDLHWNALPPELKARLRDECARALAELDGGRDRAEIT